MGGETTQRLENPHMSPFTCQIPWPKFNHQSGDWGNKPFYGLKLNPPQQKHNIAKEVWIWGKKQQKTYKNKRDLERSPKISTPCCSKAYHFSGLMSSAKVWDLTKPCLPSGKTWIPLVQGALGGVHLSIFLLRNCCASCFFQFMYLHQKHWVFHSFGALDLNQKNCWSKWHIFNLPLSNKNLASFKYFMTRFHLHCIINGETQSTTLKSCPKQNINKYIISSLHHKST